MCNYFLSPLQLLLYHGQEDQCFFNSRCLTAFGTLPDFARVFTNIGYLLCGAAFIIIVKEHKKFTENILRQYGANNVSHCREKMGKVIKV